ncbi:hypothetical protein PQQ86_39115 [Paraburkholderia sediminicola]|uniref:TRAFAC clade GTPase domain-containing protein n=1 Tax=Paraburkholderia sediminicola TaxID=458836 RepID=UPI0038BD43BB
MTSQAVVLVGGPDSGKTNYLGRLWAAVNAGKGRLRAARAPGDIEYVEEILSHLLQGGFAPRSDKNLETRRTNFSVSLTLADSATSEEIELTVPDVLGELWKNAVETLEIREHWMSKLQASTGALLFVRIHSDQNVAPMDWVTAQRILELHGDEGDAAKIPTQVFLCELVRFLEHTLIKPPPSQRPRVAVVVTAWDLLDADTSAGGPGEYLRKQYPLFAGRILDTERLEVRVFGVSIVGGDLTDDEAFRQSFVDGDLLKSGYVVSDGQGNRERSDDITLPVAWLVAG